jgi:two-component system sensor histidine kinase KdpD
LSGRLKIFLGMAAGVGKTYRMLQEGRAEADDGRDVVIGVLETHGREETAAQADGLEIVPRRTVERGGHALEEMDLPAVLARAPELCLVDELAHTNAPGLEHGKRFEDMADLLEADIDVFSTVNVQHLESLNDQVHELTGVRVRETFPDRPLTEADEVVLVDLTPEALLMRLREGRVHRRARIGTALQNFSAARLDRSSERVVRRAWRSAQRLHAELDILVVRPPGEEASADARAELETLRRITAVLGAGLVVEEGDDVAEPLPLRLLRLAPDLDVASRPRASSPPPAGRSWAACSMSRARSPRSAGGWA